MLRGSVVVQVSGPITPGSGNYCRAICAQPTPVLPPAVSILGVSQAQVMVENLDEFDSGTYKIVTGAGVTGGSVQVALLQLSPSGTLTWITATSPNSSTGAPFSLIPALSANLTYNGSLTAAGFFPEIGIGLIVTSLAGGNITLMQLNLTRR